MPDVKITIRTTEAIKEMLDTLAESDRRTIGKEVEQLIEDEFNKRASAKVKEITRK